jgi:small subunit ribosomal protein S1
MTEELTQGTADAKMRPTSIRELRPKMKLQGRVTRVELFGAFVDVGVGRDGLIHISQLQEDRVNRVTEVVNEGDEVTVWVQKVDLKKNRLSLTMIEPPERTIEDLEPDMVLTGRVTRLERYGVFVDIGVDRDGMVHVSEIAQGYVRDPAEYVSVGEKVEVRVVSVNLPKNRIELSLRDLPSDKLEEDQDESEEDTPTAVELALKEAMSQPSQEPAQKARRKRRKTMDTEQAEALARTLRIVKSEQ